MSSNLRYLERPGGRLSYTIGGSGPLVIAVPGMGDLRSVYRDLAGPIIDSGYQLATLDLRGHGDSDTTFTEHGDVQTARDILALITELGQPAVVLGNSMSGSAATWAAAEHPDAVTGLVLFSPFLREPVNSRTAQVLMRGLYRALFAKPWGAAIWARYYVTLNTGAQAPWLPGHRAEILGSLRQPGRLRSLRQLAVQLDHSAVEKRLPEVEAPALVLIGENDPDFRSPAEEARWIADAINAEAELVPDAGHYPQAQRPDLVVGRVLSFLARVAPTGQNPAPKDATDA